MILFVQRNLSKNEIQIPMIPLKKGELTRSNDNDETVNESNGQEIAQSERK